jgi:adenosylcobinamide-GDP ribazoletransferase
MSRLRYVTSVASAKSQHVVGVGPLQVVCATAWFVTAAGTLAALGYVSPARVAAVAIATAAVTAITGWRYTRRVGGFTGDFLGATEQLGEIAALAVLAFKL